VKDTDLDIIEKLGVSEFPSLVVLSPAGEQTVYDGEQMDLRLLQVFSLTSAQSYLCSADKNYCNGCAGRFKAKELSAFLSKHAAEQAVGDANGSASKESDTSDDKDKVVPQVLGAFFLIAKEVSSIQILHLYTGNNVVRAEFQALKQTAVLGNSR